MTIDEVPDGAEWTAMSVGQAALWFEQAAKPFSNSYNLAQCVRFSSAFDLSLLQQALSTVAGRHPLLTARFDLRLDQPSWQAYAHPLQVQLLTPVACGEDQARMLMSNHLLAPYRLAQDPPFRVAVVLLEDGGMVLALGCHHIVADLHSAALVLQELEAAYGALPSNGLAVDAARTREDYRTFCKWQQEQLGSKRAARDRSFWADETAGLGQDLPRLTNVPGGQAPQAGKMALVMSNAKVSRLQEMARAAGSTVFALLLTAFQALLAHRLGLRRAVVGTPVSGRGGARFSDIAGYCVNLLPMVYERQPGDSFRTAYSRQATGAARAMLHARLPYAHIVSAHAGSHGGCDRAGLCHATLSYQTSSVPMPSRLLRLVFGMPGGRLVLGAQEGLPFALPEVQAQFPLGLMLVPTDEALLGALQFDPFLVKSEVAAEFLDDWLRLVDACVSRPDDLLDDLLDRRPHGTVAKRGSTLSAQVDAALLEHQDAVALEGPGGAVSYAQLDQWAGRLKDALRHAGVKPGDRVAVIDEGSTSCVPAMLAAWRCGAAFVPLDCDVAPQRLLALVVKAKVAAVVFGMHDVPAWAHALDVPLLSAGHASAWQTMGTGGRALAASLDRLDPAWLMFTSGTTGEPKGAVVPQEAALLHARAMKERLMLEPRDRVLQFTSLSFDEHAEEIFPALLAGACLVFQPRVRHFDPERLLQLVRDRCVSVLHLPTSYWHLWMDETRHQALPLPEALRLVNVGGEPASLKHLTLWAGLVTGRHTRWINTYGLTEAAVTSLVYEWDGDAAGLAAMPAVPVGRPLGGTRIRVVDPHGQDVAVGQTGQLWLGGAGVGTGYFDNPTETRARFGLEFALPCVRWLRTGDLARQDETGDIVLVGRQDGALKIRGVRIDIQALQSAARTHDAVQDAVVADAAERGFDLHLVMRPTHGLDEMAFRQWWHESLASWPQPSLILVHARIPRTPGLKPDHQALRLSVQQRPQPPAAGQGSDESSSDSFDGDAPPWQEVCSLFDELLQHGGCRAADDFFALGGDSLLAMRLVARVRRAWQVPFDVTDFLANPTPIGVARLCRQRKAAGLQLDPPALDSTGSYPLSRAQQRALWFQNALDIKAQAMPSILLRAPPGLDPGRLERALHDLANCHRLVIADITESGNQEVASSDGMVSLRLMDVSVPAGLAQGQIAAWLKRACAQDPRPSGRLDATLFTCRTAGGYSEEAYLLLQARPTAVDGSSVALLVGALQDSYQGRISSHATCSGSYRAFVAAEAAWRGSWGPQLAQTYWQNALSDAPAPARLAGMGDSVATLLPSRKLRLRLGSGRSRALQQLAASQQCSVSTALLAAFVVFVSRQQADPDVLMGMPVSLRGSFGMDAVVGPTLNPLPWRARIEPDDLYVDVLARTRSALADALRHGALPYEEIIAVSGLHGLRAAPLPIQFVGQPAWTNDSPGEPSAFYPVWERDGHSPVSLLVNVEVGDSARVEFEYQAQVLSDRQAVRLLRSFRILLGELLARPAQPVGAARMQRWADIALAWRWQPALPRQDRPTLLHSAIGQWAASDPDRLALIGGSHSLTYAQLDRLSDHHAALLAASGVRAGDRVLVSSGRSVGDALAVIATLKAGAIYVPVSCSASPARKSALAQLVDARAQIGARPLLEDGHGPATTPFVPIDFHPERLQAFNPPMVAQDASAYILFTSGTTGQPKGVEVSHAAALGTVEEIIRRFELTSKDVFYGTAPLGFDLSVFDLFATLQVGGSLIRSTSSVADPQEWSDDIAAHGVTVWNSVPSGLELLLQASGHEQRLVTLRLLLVSGDWIPLNLPGKAREQCAKARFIAMGGATEASIWSNWQEVDGVAADWRSIPYGRPLDGQAMYVLEAGGWPTPAGVPGEIWIGGDGLAKGYWGAPQLTAERFAVHGQTGMRLYRTGDRGSYMDDGRIEILGRVDRQLKVRGCRVEPSAVEAVLVQVPGVRRAIVHAFGPDKAPLGLAAYILLESGQDLPLAALRAEAQAELPEYMRPSTYQVITALPLGKNGKIDKGRLERLPVSRQAARGNTPVMSAAERRLVSLWQQVLPMGQEARPGQGDNFFALGGDSLLAARLIGKVRTELGWDLSLAQWLAEPTLDRMLQLGERAGGIDGHQPVRVTRSTEGLAQRVMLDDDLVIKSVARGDENAIFITGASGLIGSRLAVQLLRDTEQSLMCLVRRGAGARLMRLLRGLLGPDQALLSRVRLIEGDLAMKRLGLGQADFEALAKSTAQIFHAGAAVNLVADYESLSAVNVRGTHEIIRLSLLGAAQLHHISSIGVLPYGAGRLVRESDPIDVEGPLSTGYCQTKWVAEQMVRLAMRRGVNATIYRPGLTVGSEAGPQGSSLLFAMLRLAQMAQALPKIDLPIDLVDAGDAAAAISHIARDPKANGRTFHLTHPQPITLESWLKRTTMPLSRLPLLSFTEWQLRIAEKLEAVESSELATLGELILGQTEEDITPAKVDCANTTQWLRSTPVRWTPVEQILNEVLG